MNRKKITFFLVLFVLLALDRFLKVYFIGVDRFSINDGFVLGGVDLGYLGLFVSITLISLLISVSSYILPKYLIVVGAVSNLFDRVIYGGVVDFIYLFDVAFNVADVFIVLGVTLLIIEIIYEEKIDRRKGI